MLLHKHFQIKPFILNTRRFSMEREGVLITAEHPNYPPIFINFISKCLDVALIDFVKEQQQ